MSHTDSNVVIQQSKSKKWLIYASLGLSMLTNLVAVFSLLIGGMFGIHTYLTITLIVIDALLLIIATKTNFRFSYSKTLPIFFSVVKIALTLLVLLASSENVFSSTAIIIFILTQAFSIISLFIALLDASKHGGSITFLAITTALLLALSSMLFIAHSLSAGFFGQGNLTCRAVTYTYLSQSDTYRVDGLVPGFGNKIIIPETFNGKTVSEIDTTILQDVKEVQLNTKTACFIETDSTIKNQDLVIYVQKKDTDSFKQSVLSKISQGTLNKQTALTISNAITPTNLTEDEVFISFYYSPDSFDKAKQNLLPTWYGKKSDVFNVAEHGKNINYAKDYDLANENYLYKCFLSNGYTLSPLTYKNENIQGKKISTSIAKLEVNFEKVLRVKIEEDNDTKYEPSDSFKSFNGTGYRYVVKSDPTNLLSQIDQRQGFTLSWQQSKKGSKETFYSLPSILDNKDVTIYPNWALERPIVENLTTNKNNIIYGEDFTLSTTATHSLSTLNLSYRWFFDNVFQSNGDNTFTVSNAKPSQSGTYRLYVVAQNDAITSLTSQSFSEINVTVNKKPLSFDWSMPNGVYSGTEKTISCSYAPSDVINGDSISFNIANNVAKDVGYYNATVSLNGDCANLYTIKEESKTSPTLKITPYELNVSWQNTALTYNGKEQKPTIETVNGLESDGIIGITVNGQKKNVGEYTATATSNNSNYKIVNNSQPFNIGKKALSATWSNVSLTYNGKTQKPTATLVGVISGDNVVPTVSGGQLNAGNNYLATVSVSNGNYKLVSGTEQTFSIEKKTLTAEWSNTSLTYNGMAQKPIATIKGLIPGDNAMQTISGEQTNAGNNYTAVVSISNNNYQLVAGKEQTFSIQQKSLSVAWSNTTLVYNGTAQKPTATLVGLIPGDNVVPTVSGEQTNAGINHLATATLTHQNYRIGENATTTFSIEAKQLTVIFISTEKELSEGVFSESWITLSDGTETSTVGIVYEYYQNNIKLSHTPQTTGEYQLHVLATNNNYVLIGETVKTISLTDSNA